MCVSGESNKKNFFMAAVPVELSYATRGSRLELQSGAGVLGGFNEDPITR
jgi:hypothetical protein